MFKRKMAAICFSIVAGSMMTGNAAMAQDSELKFVSNIAAVAEDGSTITITVRGIDVVVDVNADTEIKIEGDDVDLDGLSAGDSVEIEAFFATGGRIVADEIAILDRGLEEFRFKGQVSEVDFAATAPDDSGAEVVRISLLGTDVYVNEEVRIVIRGVGRVGRGRSDERSFSDLDMHLAAGDNISVRGTYDGTALWARDLKIGGRDDGEIEVEGEIAELRDDGFLVTIEDAGDFVIQVDENTELKGDLVVGTEVKIEGILTEDAAILAFEVKGEGADDDDDEDDEEDEVEDDSTDDVEDDSTVDETDDTTSS